MEKIDTKFGKITPEQNAIRERVIAIAQEEGVDPGLAEAIAWAESGFGKNTGPSKTGAVGIMQVDPKNTKGLGITKETLQDTDGNIRAGVTLLKNSLERFGGNEILGVAGYNTRFDTSGKFAKSRNPDDLPKATIDYLDVIDKYRPLMAKPGQEAQPAEQPQEDKLDTVSAAPDENLETKVFGELDMSSATALSKKQQDELDAEEAASARERGRFAGAATGAGLSGAALLGSGAGALIGKAGESYERGRARVPPVMPTAPGAAPPAAAQPGGLQPRVGAPFVEGVPTAGGLPASQGRSGYLPKGTEGSQTYNYAKSAKLSDIEAARALDMTKQAGGVHDLTTQRREAMQRIRQMFPGEQFVENPRYSGLMTPQQSVGLGPRAPYEGAAMSGQLRPPTVVGAGSPPPISMRPIPPRTSALDSITNTIADMIGPASKTGRVVGSVLKYGAPPLALAQAGAEVQDIRTELSKAKKEERSPDIGYLARRGIGAVGSTLSAFPGGQSIGLPMAVGPSVYEYLRSREKQPAIQYEGGGLDPMGSPTQ